VENYSLKTEKRYGLEHRRANYFRLRFLLIKEDDPPVRFFPAGKIEKGRSFGACPAGS